MAQPNFYEIVITNKDEPFYVLRFYTDKMIDNCYWKTSYEEFMEHVDIMKRAHGIGE